MVINFKTKQNKTGVTVLTTNLSQKLIIPDVINGQPVTEIGDVAFYNRNEFSTLVIPNSVISIGNYAFAHCSGLVQVTIPENVEYIGEYAFANCISLINLIIPKSITYIGDHAFSNCLNLKTATIPRNVAYVTNTMYIGRNAFDGHTLVKYGFC